MEEGANEERYLPLVPTGEPQQSSAQGLAERLPLALCSRPASGDREGCREGAAQHQSRTSHRHRCRSQAVPRL